MNQENFGDILSLMGTNNKIEDINCNNYNSKIRSIKLNSLFIEPMTFDEDDRDLNDPDRMRDYKEDFEIYGGLINALLPLSSQEKELKKRLKTEITDEMRKNKTLKEIDELENKIKQEIESHYNKFDENELTYDNNNNNNNNNNSYQKSAVEIIALRECDIMLPSREIAEKFQLKYRCESHRIETTLGNLKCLQIQSNQSEFCFKMITSLLNNTANQLRSLHIDDYIELLQHRSYKWKFLDIDPWDLDIATPKLNDQNDSNDNDNEHNNNTARLQEMQKESWYPVNIEELCFDNNRKISKYWWIKYINSKTFPHLKRVKIAVSINRQIDDKLGFKIGNLNASDGSINSTIKKISSLISNGIELIHFCLKKFEYYDFIDNLYLNSSKIEYVSLSRKCIDPCGIIQLWNKVLDHYGLDKSNDESSSHDESRLNPFVLKLELNVQWNSLTPVFDPDMYNKLKSDKMQKKLISLMQQVGLLFININTRLQNDVMFAFKINFHVEKGMNNINHASEYSDAIKWAIEQCLQNRVLLLSGENKIIETSINQYELLKDCESGIKEIVVVLGVVFKNKHKGISNNTCQLCYIDPQFEYQCCNCQSQPWME